MAYFLALLELARWGILRVNQESMYDAISIDYDEEAAEARFAELVAGESQ